MAKYPTITAGQRITADLLTDMLPLVVVKTSPTDRTNTTLTIDPDLQFDGAAGATYLVEFNILPAALLAADFVTEWSVPSDASGFKSVLGPSSTANNGSADNVTMRCGVHNFGTDITYSGVRDSGSAAFVVQEWSVITLTSAGTVGIAWAQGTTNATAARMGTGSYMRVTRIA